MTEKKGTLINLLDAMEALTKLDRHAALDSGRVLSVEAQLKEANERLAVAQRQIDSIASNFALVLVSAGPVTVYPSDRERLGSAPWRIESDALPEERQRFKLVIDAPKEEAKPETTATTDERDRLGLAPVPPEKADA